MSISLLIPGKFGPNQERYSYCYEIRHSEQVKFVNHKYDIIGDLQKPLFTNILQNSYFDKIYEL